MREVLKYLKTRPDVVAWRQNSGMMRASYKGSDRVIRFGGMPGIADIIGWVRAGRSGGLSGNIIVPSSRVARFLAVECKRVGQPLTMLQERFLQSVQIAGGIGIVAYDVGDVVRALAAAR